MPKFDRLVPPDWDHYAKFPLTATTAPLAPTPMVAGVDWYDNFDRPERDKSGHYWIGRTENLGSIRGGHCVALRARGQTDSVAWQIYYNQGNEGACVGYGCSRLVTLMNRRRYDARWLYHEAQRYDEWPGEAYEGTSVRAGLRVLADQGHIRVANSKTYPVSRDEGIREYRWADDVNDALEVLGYQDRGYVDILNSWGRSYPHLVRMPAETLERLLLQDGEIAVVTDR